MPEWEVPYNTYTHVDLDASESSWQIELTSQSGVGVWYRDPVAA